MLSAESDESSFGALGAHPSLAGALAERGYLTPTPVQAAVLGAPARDLLVSAQTGSGKTVAFGLIVGRLLLGDAETLPSARASRPRALVVAPTRELAVQVQRELDWLFSRARARVAACTGGTDLRLDARTLGRGVDVVVGTPGRLVDLLQRGTLELSAVEVLVLDEADEMLDLGFRDALEELLGAAPKGRRTLFFSATLPAPIRKLAERFQTSPLAIDPRAAGPLAGRIDSGAPAAHHDDIEHVAHLCASGERLGALVNVLRMRDDERAIVFCRTREAVADLHRALTARGFLATAISGERAQAERTRALEALRQGRVRILVATNVAARGLDLPDLGLVVHLDLPDTAEALTHRSGRTGRAGKKGVNVFLVEAGERRRAERLFQSARLRLPFSAPPSASAIAAHDRERLIQEVEQAMRGAAPSPEVAALATRLLSEHAPAEIVATLLQRTLVEWPVGERLTPIDLTAKRSPSDRLREPQKSDPKKTVLFRINLGVKDRAEPNWLLPLICRRGGVTRKAVGAIRIARDHTYFEIAADLAAEFAQNASERDPRAAHVVIGRAAVEETLPTRSFAGPPAASKAKRVSKKPKEVVGAAQRRQKHHGGRLHR